MMSGTGRAHGVEHAVEHGVSVGASHAGEPPVERAVEHAVEHAVEPAVAHAALERLAHEADAGLMSETAMCAWAARLGHTLPTGAVLALDGEVGAGKTTLVRALCTGRGVLDPAEVTSPTFAIVQEYALASGHVLHADLYRLRTDAELDQLGWDELVANAQLICVEWPDRVADRLPHTHFTVRLGHVPGNALVRAVQLRLPPLGCSSSTPT